MEQAKECGLYFSQFQKDLAGTRFSLCWKWLFSIPYPDKFSSEYKKFFNLQSIKHKKVNPLYKTGLSDNGKTLSPECQFKLLVTESHRKSNEE